MTEPQELAAAPRRKRARSIPPTSKVAPFKRALEEAGLWYKSGRAAVQRGEITIIKIGRNWYVRRTEIERFLEANTLRYESVAR